MNNFKNKMNEFSKLIKSAKKNRKKWMKYSIKTMGLLLQTINEIGTPKNNDEYELLKLCVDAYDDTVKKLEEEFLVKCRKVINE